jgi:hypothetical protein
MPLAVNPGQKFHNMLFLVIGFSWKPKTPQVKIQIYAKVKREGLFTYPRLHNRSLLFRKLPGMCNMVFYLEF